MMAGTPVAKRGDAAREARADLEGCRALVLMGRAPWPLDDGWKTRSGNLLKGLAARGASVDLIAFGDPSAEVPDTFRRSLHRVELVPRDKAYAPLDLLRGALFGTPFSVLNYRSAAFAERVRALSAAGRYDLLLVEDVVMAQYATLADARVRFLDMHNLESHLMRRYAALERRWPHKLYALLTASKLAAYERAVTSRFRATFVCSDDDADRLRALGAPRGVVIPNGVDASYFHSPVGTPIDGSIVFVGSMDYHANISGVLHFAQRVLPLVRARLPRAVTFVVGKNPPREIRDLASDAVTVTGAVPDVRPYLARAGVAIVPLLVGGGTRLKILEAMAMGKAIVSTRVGTEGIPVRDGETLALADDPAAFAERVVELVQRPDLAEAMGRRAREYVRSHYDWDAIVGRVVHAYHDAASHTEDEPVR